jgi:glycosyltransferase involved in cell wall biosynthesis
MPEVTAKKKLVFFGFVPHFGGAQRCTVLLCEKLNEFNQVHVIDAYGSCREYVDALTARNIYTHILMPEAKSVVVGYTSNPVKRVFGFIKQVPAFLILRSRLVKKIVEINPDVVWTNGFKSLFFLTISLRLWRYPIAYYAHGWYKRKQVPAYARWLIKYRPQGILAVSNPTSENIQSWGVASEKIHVVFNTVDFENIINEGNKEPSCLPPGMGREFKILVPAVLLRTKGQHTAIKAADILKRKGLDFAMWLVGNVSIGDKSGYRGYLQELIRTNGLGEHVYLLGWRNDVWPLMRLTDVVVLPTHTEGLPSAIQEAMILKRPVISTPVGGIPDLIIDGQTGLLVPVDDEKALAVSIEKILKDKNLFDMIVKNGYNHIYNEFSTEKHITRVRQAIDAIAEN